MKFKRHNTDVICTMSHGFGFWQRRDALTVLGNGVTVVNHPYDINPNVTPNVNEPCWCGYVQGHPIHEVVLVSTDNEERRVRIDKLLNKGY